MAFRDFALVTTYFQAVKGVACSYVSKVNVTIYDFTDLVVRP